MENTELPQLPFICYSSRRKMLFSLIVSLLFVVSGIFLLKPEDQDNLPLLFSIAVFAIFSVISLIFLVRKAPLYTISEDGITVGNNKLFIKWSQIAHIQIVEQRITGRTYEWLGIFLKDEVAFLNTLKPLARKLAESTIGMVGATITLDCINGQYKAKELSIILNSYLQKSRSQ